MSKFYYRRIFNPLTFFCALFTGIVGYTINNGSIFWAVVDFLFWPYAIIKWLICQEICISVIKDAFSFFMK